MDSSMSELEYFSSISSSNKATRLNSARGILKRIKQSSKNSHHAVYLICKRLFRGLGASNPGLRQGCFTAVVGFLKLLPAEFNLDSLEEIIVSELSPVGNNSKLEEGEAYLGQSLAYGAMIVSGILCEMSEEEKTAVFQKLFEISKKRSYLHHSSFSFLTMLLKKSGKEFNPDGFISHMQDLSTYTFDKLDYLITLVELQVKSPTIKKVFGTKRLFDVSNANNISTLLKKIKSLKMFEHTFFNNFVHNIVQHPEFFKTFWNSFCDKHIKSEMNKADNIKTGYDLIILHFSLMIFKECTKNKSAELVEIVFNDEFLNVILRQARKEKHLVKSVLEEFCNGLKTAEDELKLRVIRHILFDQGLLNFDHTTGSKTLLFLSNSLSFNAVSELASDYRSVLEFKKEIPQKDIESKYKSAIICLNFYSKIINSPICCDQIDWRLSQLVYLLKLGFFKLPDSPFNREFNQCVQEAFLTSLGHRFPSLESFQLILEGIVSKLNVLFKDLHISPIIKFNPEMFEAWSTGNDLAKKMEKFIEKNPSHKEIVFVLKLIVQYMAILLLKEPNTAVMNIQDLKNIYKELTEKQNVDKTMWIRVLIDLFLNLLSKPNYHHRHIIRCTFKFLCPHLSEEAFLQIIEVLDPSFESGNKEIEDEMDEEEEEGENDKLEENESGSESAESSDDEEMDEELSTNEKLRLELQNALGALSETESVDIDDMDEEEGKKLDETLSNIFRANVKKKKGDHLSKYQNQLAHFRTRVMDLIEICTEVVLPLSFWIKALGPLVALLESSVGQTKLECLRSRIRCCLKKLNASKTTCDEMPMSEIVPLLENLLEKVSKSGIFVDMKTELVMTLKFLLKASKPFREGLKPKVLEKNEVFQCVNNSFRSMFEGKTNFPPQLITGLTSIGWDGILAMIPAMLKYLLDSSLKPHKKLICFQILESFIKTPKFFDGHLDKYYKYYLPDINELFTKYIDNETNTMCMSKVVNNKYHSHLWNLMIVIINKQSNSQAPNLILTDTVQNIISSNISRIPPMKGECKNNFRKLCNLLNVRNMETNGSNSIEKSFGLESTVNSQKSLLKRKRKSDVISKRKKKIKTLK